MPSSPTIGLSFSSHIYVETSILDHPVTKHIVKKFPKSTIIPIEHYKDVFNRPNQSWRTQKKAQKLILAHRKDSFLYPGSELTPAFGNARFYYNAMILNCLYDCDYCYLQGLFPSAHTVLFVNNGDYIDAVKKELQSHNDSMYVALSYDTDLLAFENIYPYAQEWINYCATEPRLTVEIRTKSANYRAISGINPLDNVVLAWSLSPHSITQHYEKKTASFERRLQQIKQASEDGWKVRICIDPILPVPDWQKEYKEMARRLANEVNPHFIVDISIGTFRMNHAFLKRIRQQRNDSPLLYDNFETKNGVVEVEQDTKESLLTTIETYLGEWISPSKIIRV